MENNYVKSEVEDYPKQINLKSKDQVLLERFQYVVKSLRKNYGWSNKEIISEVCLTYPTYYKLIKQDTISNFNSNTKTLIKELIYKYNYGGLGIEPVSNEEIMNEMGKESSKAGEKLRATVTKTGKSVTDSFVNQAIKAEKDIKNISNKLEWWGEIAKLIAEAPKGVSITISFAQ